MRIAGETVGPRGVTVLAVSAAVGIVLGVHGWTGRHNGLPSTLAGPGPSSSAAPQARPGSSSAAPTPGSPTPGHSTQGPPTQGPTAPGSPAPSSPAPASPAPSPGPKLSSQSYASYAFQEWPGPVSSAAKAAATGLVITVRKHGSGIMVTAGVAGRPAPAPRFYPTGTKVYVIEASMGDDSGNSDYNLGDDGLAVTDSQGRILQ
jgi:hypothetical protein